MQNTDLQNIVIMRTPGQPALLQIPYCVEFTSEGLSEQARKYTCRSPTWDNSVVLDPMMLYTMRPPGSPTINWSPQTHVDGWGAEESCNYDRCGNALPIAFCYFPGAFTNQTWIDRNHILERHAAALAARRASEIQYTELKLREDLVREMLNQITMEK